MAGDLPAALESLRWAVGVGVAPVLIADALADGMRTVAKVSGARGGNSYALASQLGMPPWKVDRARGTARGWSSDGLAVGMAVVAELNAAVKGSAVDPEYALEQAVIDLVAARPGADGANRGRHPETTKPSRPLRRLSIGAGSPIASRPTRNRSIRGS